MLNLKNKKQFKNRLFLNIDITVNYKNKCSVQNLKEL